MAISNESDENVRSRSIQTKEEAMDAWRYWLSWGENDKIGAYLIDQIARFGLGDAEIIQFLEGRTNSGILLVRSAASRALDRLANQGDEQALAAQQRCQQYERDRVAAERRAQAERQRAWDQKQADAAGLSLDDYYAEQQRKALAKQRAEEERRRELAKPSHFLAGQRVKCIVQDWPYANQIGLVERAVNKYFVVVVFEDGYRTIQPDSAFVLCAEEAV